MARAERSEPKPTLLASLGVRAGPDDAAGASPGPVAAPAPAEKEPGEESDGISRPGEARGSRKKSPAQSAPAGTEARPPVDEGSPASPADDALQRIRQQHRVRRTEGPKPPLAPLNVDVPIDLLQHVKWLSGDIPYPLRRVVEEALELWLVATGNTRPAG